MRLKSRTRLPRPLHAPKQPIRKSNKLGTDPLLPIITLLSMFNRMAEYLPLGIKLEDKQARELTFPIQIQKTPLLLVRRRPPLDDQLLPHGALAFMAEVLRHALGKDLEFYVADYGKAVPGDRRGPDRCYVGDAAGDGGEVRVG